jgi:hypothetical protein
LDADEQLTPALKTEIERALGRTDVDGFELALKFVWRGAWVKRGYYRTAYKTVLFRTGRARCDDRGVNEHMLVDGRVAHCVRELFTGGHAGTTVVPA